MIFLRQPCLSILIYHRVLAQPDPMFPDQLDSRQFERQMALLKRCCNVMPLGAAAAALRRHALPPRAVCITFDDGYADNAEVALPILLRHGLSACFFIASGYLDGGCMWNDTVIEHVRRAAGPRLDLSMLGLGVLPIADLRQKAAAIAILLNHLKYLPFAERAAKVALLQPQSPATPMMCTGQVRMLHRAGMEIGAHTSSHPILARQPAREAQADIAAGKYALERIIDAPVPAFAYPNGKPGLDYNARHVQMAKTLGFELAVSTMPGAARYDSDLFQLPRFTPWQRNRLRFWLSLQRNKFIRPA